MKPDQERVRTLLLSTITQLCQNGLLFKKDLKVQGLLAITVDDDEIFVVQLNENLATKIDPECVSVPVPPTSLPDVPGLASPVVSTDFPVASKPAELLASQQTATGELVIARVAGGPLEVGDMMSGKTKVSPHFSADSGREAVFIQNGGHDKLDGGNNIDFGAGADMKGMAENSLPVLLPAFSIPMTVNYSEMKAFQGAAVECFRGSNSDQIDYVFQDFQTSAIQSADPGRLTCQAATAQSAPVHIQAGFPSDGGVSQAYQQFTSMLAAAPQNPAKLDLSGIGKRILPHAIGQTGSYATGQAQVTSKKSKQESRLPRRPRESTEKRFRCQLCSLTYYYKKHLKFHMQQKHGIQQT